MKIAVFHNFMDNIGGAEIVTLTLARELNADVYTTNINPEHIREMGFEDVLPRIYSIGKIPIHAPFRQQLCFYKFWRLDVSKLTKHKSAGEKYATDTRYDRYIIAGDWAMSGAVHNKPNLWYVHSPLHELWAFKDKIRNTMVVFWKRPIYDFWVWFNRKLTLSYAQHVQHFAANSENTKERVKKYYGKDATVINPPIDTKKFRYEKTGDYWLAVNRIVRHKRIEIQTEAFKNLPDERLIIVGSYEKEAEQFEEYKSEIERTKPDNVEIRSWVNSAELTDLYAKCKGFITTSMEEDFGMTAIEALASGKPVIAPNEGGYKETQMNGTTGILIDDIDSEKLAAAVRKISTELAGDKSQVGNGDGADENGTINYIEKYKQNSATRARDFDISIFIAKIKELLG